MNNKLPRHAFLPNCENPQPILANTAQDEQGPRMVPCGHCYSCLCRKVNVKAGQLLAEFAYPHHPAWEEPGLRGQFWTLTHNPESLPVTQPFAHDLSLNWDQTAPYTGPFVRQEGRSKPAMIEGIAYKTVRGELTGVRLSPGELALEHQLHLERHLRWSPDMVQQWTQGTYEPQGTLVMEHIQGFKKRCQTWWHREYGHKDGDVLLSPRWANTGEYGDQYGRPHYHVIPFGWPTDPLAQEFIHDAWATYNHGSLVDPRKRDAIHMQKSFIDVKGAAAAYTAKDLVKDRRHQRRTPALAARLLPFVRQSLKPPLGVAACEVWLGRDMVPIWDKHRDETDRCYAMRQAYTAHTLHLPEGRRETFITSDWWRGQVQALFDPEVWEETTHRLNADHADLVLAAEADPLLEAEANDYIDAVAEKNRRNEERALDRKARKSALRQQADRL